MEKIGKWTEEKYTNNNGFGGFGEWENGEKITFENCSDNQKQHCSVKQLIAIEAEVDKVSFSKRGEWGNQTYYDILA